MFTTYHSGNLCRVNMSPTLMERLTTPQIAPLSIPKIDSTIAKNGAIASNRLYPNAKKIIPLIMTSRPFLANQIIPIVKINIITSSNNMLPASFVPSPPKALNSSKLYQGCMKTPIRIDVVNMAAIPAIAVRCSRMASSTSANSLSAISPTTFKAHFTLTQPWPRHPPLTSGTG